MTDVIADMLTRIRNALNAKHETVEIPASNTKKAIANILLNEGYISNVELIEGVQGTIKITLKYDGTLSYLMLFHLLSNHHLFASPSKLLDKEHILAPQ